MSRRSGFSWIELIVLVVVAGVVIALILLRMSGGRESARRVACENNLRLIFVALESYSLQVGHLPIGTQNPTGPIRSEPVGYHQNWITGALPQLNYQELYEQIDFDFGVYADENRSIAAASLPALMCPASENTLPDNATSYAGVYASEEMPISGDGDGMFLLNRPLSSRDAVDGVAYVFISGEKSREIGEPLPWNSGTRSSLRTMGWSLNSPELQARENPDPLLVGGFSSNHPGGAYFLMVGGEFRFYSEQTDLRLMRQLASRGDATQGEAEPESASAAESVGSTDDEQE